MRYQSLVAALSLLGSAALALHDQQFPISTAGEPCVRPLDITNLNNGKPHSYSFGSNIEEWRFDEGPAENATGNLIFDTVHSLLQHWSNTRYRNGHNMVPGVIPTGTLLYHGTSRNTIPSGPDWIATDPEHSLVFARGDGSGWHLTLAAMRPLKVLYFDGSSAAKLSEGTMDTQDIIAWGEVQPERVFDEQSRIKDLCSWGKEFGIDGFASEVMLCDFTAGVEVVSFLHVRVLAKEKNPWPYRDPTPPPPDPDALIRTFEAMHSGSWHNRYPGDSRIVLDLTGLVSLYDIALAPSLVPVRAGLERCDHRVLGISSEDISRVKKRLIEVITRPDPGSGIDWKTLTHVIVDRYADRLELMQHLLNFTSSDSQELLQRAKLVQIQLRIMFTPYLLDDIAVPSAGASGVGDLQWASPIFRHCATTHTTVIKNQMPSMTPSERLLLKAIEDTTREICRVTTNMWAVGVLSGLDDLFPIKLNGEPNVAQMMIDWRRDIQKLMSWLDWSIWIKCQPACAPEEMCYLPTWPVNAPMPQHPRPLPRDPRNTTDAPAEMDHLADRVGHPPEDPAVADAFFFIGTPTEEWRKPHPKCIRLIAPYEF
ncbi:hypothetical protein CY34DRAFT_13942 [Suillus luteus UH-Slu-Lm8-n1]|uniref:Uncharacterized protein n=1 Tax=Suillus luteus UH-Slu-Lm8-n1 TaxID=930992 RepID=A0A0C9ZQX7_9AGAM|nr:hypothetical protein CY34DRAFT_13942 [Suillus luteus UH-Slu-Lm8-n1]